MLREIKTRTYHYFIDENNHAQGEYTEYHINGRLYLNTFYVNNNLHGEYKSYHDNGQLWEHTFYHYGKRHGEYKRYYDNGALAPSTFYCQGINLKVDPDTLSEKDKMYIMMSGRLPPRD